MHSFRSGASSAAVIFIAVLSIFSTVAVSVFSQGFFSGLCGFAAALCFPGSSADTLINGGVPEAESPAVVPEMTETSVKAQDTEPVSQEAPTVAQPQVDMNKYTEPDDIAGMAEKFLSEYKSVSPSGKISEEFFGSGSNIKAGKAAVRNSTSTKSPDYGELLKNGAQINTGEKGEMLVLIIHTHTSEAYQLADTGVFYDSVSPRSSLPDRNITRVGEMLTEVLRSQGIGVIHDTNVYDSAYNGAYSRSREAIAKYLEQYPSIQIVLDVHRDAIYYDNELRCKPTAVIDSRKAAQIMIISGAEEGLVSSFPDWESNLAFALQIQDKAASLYDGLMKPIYFCQRKYNMDMTKCSLLIEFGTDSNTIGEAVYSAYLFGDALGQLINGYYGE